MIIREATEADAPSIAPLLGELGYPSTAEEAARRIAALRGKADVAAFVADDSGRVIGVASVQRLHVLHSDRGDVQLLLLVVAGDSRRRGAGRTLVEAAERWAMDRRCTRLLVVTGHQRADAHAFYEALGFLHTARRYVKSVG